MTSRQSHRVFDAPLSPSTSTSPLAADQETSLPAPNKTTPPSLKCLNDYIREHYDRFVAHESLERTRLTASFAEKERGYERQISRLNAVHVDIAGLLTREKTANGELHEKLDNAKSLITRLCRVVNDANFVFVDRKRGPHEIKQEEGSQECINVSDIVMSPSPAVSSLLSQIETVVAEINAQNDAGVPSPVDTSPCHSILEALGRVVDSLLVTRRIFALLQEDSKSVNAARVDAERQNESLQEKIALLQQELEQAKSDNERTSKELSAARLERENHICRPPASAYPTPAVQGNSPASLPSPPLEKPDPCIPDDDILRDACKISRKTNQTLPKSEHPESTPFPPQTPAAAGYSSASTSGTRERRRISFSDAVKRVQGDSASSTAQIGPSKPPIFHSDQQTAGPSMLPPPTPTLGIKRTSSGAHACQNVSKGPPPSLSTPASLLSSPISDKTNDPRPRKKRRLNGTPGTAAANQKHKPTNENSLTEANPTNTSTSTAGPTSASPSKHTAAQFPKTSASDLKSLKFNKSQPSNPPSTPTVAPSLNTPRPITTPTKSDKPSLKPLDLAKKSPQERAALRKSK